MAGTQADVIKVPEGAVLRGCKKTKRKLRAHLQLRAEDPVLLRQLKDFCEVLANPNVKTVYNQLQRRLVRPKQRRNPMRMPVFEDPSNQELLAKLQELGNINLRGDANTIGAHSMQLAVAMQQHYSNPGKQSVQPDERSGQLVADQLARWKLTKGQVRHDSGLNNARRNTERWLAPIKPHLQHLAAVSLAGTSLEANLKHITVTWDATWDAVWEVYLDPNDEDDYDEDVGMDEDTLAMLFIEEGEEEGEGESDDDSDEWETDSGEGEEDGVAEDPGGPSADLQVKGSAGGEQQGQSSGGQEGAEQAACQAARQPGEGGPDQAVPALASGMPVELAAAVLTPPLVAVAAVGGQPESSQLAPPVGFCSQYTEASGTAAAAALPAALSGTQAADGAVQAMGEAGALGVGQARQAEVTADEAAGKGDQAAGEMSGLGVHEELQSAGAAAGVAGVMPVVIGAASNAEQASR
ncbi:hypothetical protein HaLaN_02282 [Haematococcus lacustris]|uniref:Uncharacterized protein n=1 Tax=Haematococcus lacustris TaxID=44745 RepID=A0A699YBC0_HAELA|nr:hypothetical protein HaLaN_02282 [Haematococcus lacustris]